MAPLFAALEQRLGKPAKAEQPTEETDANLHMPEREATLWRSISEKHSIAEYEYYLGAYPQGVFAELAHMRIEALRKPDISKTILKVGALAGALAALVGLFALVREEVGSTWEILWPHPSPALVQDETSQELMSVEELTAIEPSIGANDQDPAGGPGLWETPPAPQIRPIEAHTRRERAAVAKSAHSSGNTFRDCVGCPEMVVVPAGAFLMGSPANELGRGDDESLPHQVTIPRPFAAGVNEVTRE